MIRQSIEQIQHASSGSFTETMRTIALISGVVLASTVAIVTRGTKNSDRGLGDFTLDDIDTCNDSLEAYVLRKRSESDARASAD